MFNWTRQNTTVVAVIGGSVLVMYGFYRFSVRIMKFFFNVSEKQIFNIGFFSGIIAAAGIIAAGTVASRRWSTSADSVYRAALAELRKHESVEKALGGAWRPSGFRGYKIESYQDAVSGSARRQRSSYLQPPAPRVQMIFLVKGMERNGMVSLEAYKRWGEHHFTMLSLDLKEKNSLKAEHLFLAGSSDVTLFKELSEILGDTHTSGRAQCEELGDSDGLIETPD